MFLLVPSNILEYGPPFVPLAITLGLIAYSQSKDRLGWDEKALDCQNVPTIGPLTDSPVQYICTSMPTNQWLFMSVDVMHPQND